METFSAMQSSSSNGSTAFFRIDNKRLSCSPLPATTSKSLAHSIPMCYVFNSEVPGFAPCIQEESDTRILLSLEDALKNRTPKYLHKIEMGTEMVVLAVTSVQLLNLTVDTEVIVLTVTSAQVLNITADTEVVVMAVISSQLLNITGHRGGGAGNHIILAFQPN